MTQHRRRTRLPAKTPAPHRLYELARQDLYRHIVSDVNVAHDRRHAHPAFAETRHELVLAVDLVTDQRIGIGQAEWWEGKRENDFRSTDALRARQR